ncbi:MAG: PilN domain-containing protein [Burkholderiaceae bacterium]
MNRIDIEFAPCTVQRVLRQTSPASWLFLLAAAALWVILSIDALHLQNQKNANAKNLSQVMRDAQTRLDAQNARKQSASKVVIPEAQANAVNQAIQQLNLPWRDLFSAIESATPSTIALLAIEPDAKKHVLKATAEAKTSDDMIGYIEQLKKQGLFSNVLLAKHEINEQDPNKPIRFQLEAEWIEDAP